MTDMVEAARRALGEVLDPEAGLSVIDLGLIYAIEARGTTLGVTMTFTTEACPVGPMLAGAVERALLAVPGVESVELSVTFDPPWTPERISEAGRALLAR